MWNKIFGTWLEENQNYVIQSFVTPSLPVTSYLRSAKFFQDWFKRIYIQLRGGKHLRGLAAVSSDAECSTKLSYDDLMDDFSVRKGRNVFAFCVCRACCNCLFYTTSFYGILSFFLFISVFIYISNCICYTKTGKQEIQLFLAYCMKRNCNFLRSVVHIV